MAGAIVAAVGLAVVVAIGRSVGGSLAVVSWVLVGDQVTVLRCEVADAFTDAVLPGGGGNVLAVGHGLLDLLAPIRWVEAAGDCDLGRRSGGGGSESGYREAGGELEAERGSSAAQQSLRESA